MKSLSLGRRNFLRGSLAAAALAPLASCANDAVVTPRPSPSLPSSAAPTPTDNPFGVTRGSLVDAVIFDG
ncbi:MAG TPA: twin-arginine translocation signal domain-containing protein, partial [Propionibacteriaceae bacterium]|nr:twin-arginine translocation signal domain-containing protein [Propionibacteriaceae bacterium]